MPTARVGVSVGVGDVAAVGVVVGVAAMGAGLGAGRADDADGSWRCPLRRLAGFAGRRAASVERRTARAPATPHRRLGVVSYAAWFGFLAPAVFFIVVAVVTIVRNRRRVGDGAS